MKRRQQKGEGGGGLGGLLKGGDYLKFFRQREAIDGGTAIIRGNTVFNYLFIYFYY